MAIVALPRQFSMGRTQADIPDDLPNARFGFAGYLAAMALPVLPIVLAGMVVLPGGGTMDLYPLLLPGTSEGQGWLVVAGQQRAEDEFPALLPGMPIRMRSSGPSPVIGMVSERA